uniref:Uncharacterized protein n=1 Tax=Glossina austeni TaxID=7395 RepID=A0A1A9V3S0_GLOAU
MDQQIVSIVNKNLIRRPYILQNPTLMWLRKDKDNKSEYAHNESREWLRDALPLWSRLNKRNSLGQYRQLTTSRSKNFDIEIDGILLSLWGNLHPISDVFPEYNRGKQALACCVMALCATRIYTICEWAPPILDSVVINGDRYFEQSLGGNKSKNYHFTIDDLNADCWLDSIHFRVHIEHVASGKLYAHPTPRQMNLAEALMYFFSHFQLGIVQCQKRCLAFGFVPGPDGGYFLYDCQSREMPIFPRHQASTYILLAKNLQMMLYCMVVTLNITTFHQPFALHTVELDSEFCDPINIGKLKE